MLARLKYALVAGALALAGAPSLAATPADTLVVAQNIDDMITLDPAEAYEFSGIEVDSNIYDRIIFFEPENMTKLVGGAAESWQVSADGRTFTFKMRSGMKF